MFSIPELAMPKRTRLRPSATAHLVWKDREEAKNYFIRQMMVADVEEYERYLAIYIQLIHGLSYCTD